MGSSRCGRKRMNIEGDRLSSLPDDLIHKILSFNGIKHAIETTALSSRWRYIWTSMHCLNFSITMSTEIKNYLLDGSPGATLTMVSHEEIRAVMNVASARNIMGELHVLLDKWKENSETNTAHMKQSEAPMESHKTTVHMQGEVENHRAHDTKMKCHFQERMAYIKSYWEVLNEQLEKGYKNTSCMISMLEKIEGVLTKLPTSHRDKLQARFSGLCAEADTIMDNMLDRMKMQCDKKPSRLNIFFNELATS
ncbi:hypothetical protein L1987_72246 [Smallanthus sonchifolius]|uniref:Uncharacterized protein n=1 Tax=Smallanthus sonchifolius TaxID=185202 RepID=A0ACB9AVD0_9ASTR|nr:hypothetical protein L1987_72246 [Smallanthus sonchifolius]